MKRFRGMLAAVVLALLATMLLVLARRESRPAPVARDGPVGAAVPVRSSGMRAAAPASVTGGMAMADAWIAANPTVADPDAVVARLQDLLDVQDWDAALVEARRLMKHSDAAVRREVLFAFRWIGEAAIPDMVRMMVDPDPDIADQATVFFGQTIATCDSTARQAAALSLAVGVASKRALDPVLQILAGLPEQCAAPPLLKLLASDDPEIVAKAQDALCFLSGGETHTNAAEWAAWYRQLPPQEPDPVIEHTTLAWPSQPTGAAPDR